MRDFLSSAALTDLFKILERRYYDTDVVAVVVISVCNNAGILRRKNMLVASKWAAIDTGVFVLFRAKVIPAEFQDGALRKPRTSRNLACEKPYVASGG